MSNASVRDEWRERFGRRDPKLVCVGLNYRDHAEEQGVELPKAPLLFAKFATALCGDGDPIVLPAGIGHVDAEAELAVVIGATAHAVSVDDALDAVAGYTCANDVSARDAQFGDGQWFRGKSYDGFCPVGPRIVPRDELDPSDIRVVQRLNGEPLQDSRTSNLIFGVAEVIAYISNVVTLEPGDLILTGTPDGVGVFRDPKVSLAPGDVVEVEVEGIGVLRNEVRPRVTLRSERWFGGADLAGFIHRASLHAEGISRAALSGRPVVGICNSWSELVNCNLHFRALADAVRRGVLLAGGLPLEFPTISLGENLMKPSAMLYRNLMSMDVEESIRAYPLDAVVLLGGCDKTVPAQLMGAASAGVPAIMITGGPSEPAWFRGRPLGAGTDLWHYADELRAGRMSAAEFAELEAAATPSFGTCNEMGTASTMAALVEALGLSLPGTATIPAVDAARMRAAEATGARAVDLAREGLRPTAILTADAFDNAIRLLAALGGGTNAVVHLLALAGRAGVELTLDRFAELASTTPFLVNVRPSGAHLVEQLHRAGGVPAVLNELAPLLHGDAPTVTGRTLADGFRDARALDRDVIAPLEQPLGPPGAIAVLRGSLAPSGAVIKRSAASPHLLRHRGPAVVFEDVHDVAARIDDPGLDVTADSVLVLRNSGPKGGPGMPEWGQIPVPAKLLADGVTDMVRISDARMSGTAFGTVVLHVAPESAAGGPLRAVENGDPVVLDVEGGRLDLDVPAGELAARLDRLGPSQPRYRRGYGAMFLDHVLQADEGCDFDFLRARPDEPDGTEPYGLLSGWVGGW